MKTKHIYISGANLSGCGKGIVSASLGRILKSYGYSVTIQKFDGYFNHGASSLNPQEHGEVAVLNDRTEGDQDIMVYERFIDQQLNRNNSLTSGIIYKNVLDNERQGKYLGSTIQIIPHITDEIKKYMHIFDGQYDIVIHEIGGTINDHEVYPYIEATRQMSLELDSNDFLFILLVYLPFLKTTSEVKTKIAQQGAEQCRSFGIHPDILIARSEIDFDDSLKKKLSLFTGVPASNVIKNLDAASIYHIPKMLADEGILPVLKDKLQLNISLTAGQGTVPFNEYNTKFNQWNELVLNNDYYETVNIGLIGKYVQLHDSYASVIESLRFAGWKNKINVNIQWINAEDIENGTVQLSSLKLNGILIPGGFGKRGTLGMITAAQYAREHNIPYLGICLGAQIAWIEFARNVLKYHNANSEEFMPDSPNLIVHLLDEQKNITEMANTLRLGAYLCNLSRDSLSYEWYRDDQISLRHRHRYEFNNDYRNEFEKNGVIFAGVSPDNQLVEITELINHPFFVSSQAHNEFNSRPGKPDPLFDAFIYYSKNLNRKIAL